MQTGKPKQRSPNSFDKKCMAFAGLVLFCWIGSEVSACGLDWSLPSNHFDGVDEQGHVSYWEKIGEMDCGDGLVLPLHVNFNSKRDTGSPSPYLGQGWLLPLLESKFIQESEDRFVMIQPDGLSNLFLRAEPNGSVLNGSAGWKGEIKGNTITAWAACGWKLVFASGCITTMTTPKGRRLDWVYNGSNVSELREGNITRLRVDRGVDGSVKALSFPTGRSILVAQDKKPRVQSIAGQQVIAGWNNSLSHLALADERKQSFTFGTDEETRPTLRIGEIENGRDVTAAATTSTANRQLTWDPLTKLVVRDDKWVYQIIPARKNGENAATERSTSQGEHEFWFNDTPNGVERIDLAEGKHRTIKRFLSGPLAGRIHTIEESDGKHNPQVYKASFDEVGKILRETRNESHIDYRYNPDGSPQSAYKDGNLLWARTTEKDFNAITLTTYVAGKAFKTIISLQKPEKNQ